MNGHLHIGCVQARISSAMDTPSLGTQRTLAQLRVATVMTSSDLSAIGIPPASVLVIRQIHDPKPRTLNLSTAPRPNHAWAGAVRQKMTDAYADAVRPQQGQLPSGAAAILFQDEAELWACLALDIASGLATSRWWWQVILRQLGGQLNGGLPKLLSQKPEQMPAIFYRLNEWQVTHEVLQKLSEAEATQLLGLLLQTFDIADFRDRWHSSGLQNLRPVQRKQQSGNYDELPLSGQISENRQTQISAPWSKRLIPNDDRMQHPSKEALVGLSVLLFRRSAYARSSSFQQDAGQWWSSRTLEAALPSNENSPFNNRAQRYLADRGQHQTSSESAAANRQRELDEVSKPVIPARELEEESTREGHHKNAKANQLLQDSETRWHARPQADPVVDSKEASIASTGEKSFSPSEAVNPAEAEPGGPATLSFADGITTQIGGLLYLVNVIEHLGILSILGEWGVQPHVSPWTILEVLGRGLLLPTGHQYVEDPLWAALAHLDGRESPEPLPDWSFGERALHISERWGIVASETGTLMDPLPSSPLAAPFNRGQQNWLRSLLPYVRAWLRERGSISDETTDLAFLTELLCQRSRLYVTTTHVDLVMKVDQIYLPARISGLDQNPGWLSHWGRVIQFHFEE